MTFSQRHGIDAGDPPITIRREDPKLLRKFLWNMASKAIARSNEYTIADQILSSFHFLEWDSDESTIGMTLKLIQSCPWQEVYEIAEKIYVCLQRDEARRFESDMNTFFRRSGYGWHMVNGFIEIRGPESLDATITGAQAALSEGGFLTAERELNEALRDLSRRPEADLTGAVQHAGAALECVARAVTKQPNKNLGSILDDHPELFPKPLNIAAEKVWGFASNLGRHVKEGHVPTMEEVLLMTGFAATLAAYLAKKKASPLS